MAINQFVITLVPRTWAESVKFDVAQVLSVEGFSTEHTFVGYVPPKPIAQALQELGLPPSKSWHRDLQCWGDEKHTDIQMWLEDGAVDGVTFRIDMTDSSATLLRKVETVAVELDCSVFIPEFNALLPVVPGCLPPFAKRSRAAKYAVDPIGVLKGDHDEA